MLTFVPVNNKTRKIMLEICHFYGIVITMYLPDHRSALGTLA